MLYSVLRLLAFLILKIFFRMEVKGRQHLPKEGGFILASNHVSYLDPIVLGAANPRKLNYMAKDSLFDNPASSWLFTRINMFPIKRNSADVSSLKLAITKLKTGYPLVIFPEGTRSQDGSLVNIQPGIGFLAAKSNVPIIPSFVKGTDSAWPKGSKFIRLRKISVYFGQKIPIERSEFRNYQDIANITMQKIRHLANKIKN